MDHKAWRWRKRSSEKAIGMSEETNLPMKEAEEKTFATDKTADLQRAVEDLNEKLSSAILEGNAKDNLVAKHSRVAEEAIAGWEKAEADAVFSKQQLEDSLRFRIAAEERVLHLDSALKECMQQLRFVRDEQELRIHEALVKASGEFDKVKTSLEEKISETNKKLSMLDLENGHLRKALLVKEKLVEDLSKHKTQADRDFNALMMRVDSIDKLNSSLKYEVRMLEKELEIRNEEKDFNRKTAEASHKQHLESMKKNAKLETECQRLRILVRKRLPGPAALARMKSEVDIMGRDANGARMKKINSGMAGADENYDNRRITFLVERLNAMEEENKILKESLSKKNSELQSSRIMCARTASKLSQFESHIGELGKSPTHQDLLRTGPISSQGTIVSSVCEDDGASCAESWASALISELEIFRNGKLKMEPIKKIGVSDLSLMDDFVEMEKLAIVSVGEPLSSPQISGSESNRSVPQETDSERYPSAETGKELVPVDSYLFSSKNSLQWIQDILKLISKQSSLSERSCSEVLEEVRVALENMDPTASSAGTKTQNNNLTHINSELTWRNPQFSETRDSFDGTDSINMPLAEISTLSFNANSSKSLSKMVELIEGINKQYILSKNSGSSSDYIVRVFQWKRFELSNILHKFLQSCNEFLHGKAGLEIFLEELTSSLEWITNHCFSIQDVSSMKDSIKKYFDWDQSCSESEVDDPKDIFRLEKRSDWKLKEENTGLKDEVTSMELRTKLLEDKFQTMDRNQTLRTQLDESQKVIASLHQELAALKESKGLMENQRENGKLLIEDLKTQSRVTEVDLEAQKKLSPVVEKPEDKTNCVQELDATYLELQLQLESASKKEASENVAGKEEKQLRTEWEISAASEKLAECQETILNLGRQLKALASSEDAALFDKVITSNSTTKANRRSSLLDQMIAEDDDNAEDLKSPKTKEVICTGDSEAPKNPTAGLFYGKKFSSNQEADSPENLSGKPYLSNGNKEMGVGSLAIVPKRPKAAGSFLRKLLFRRKRGNSKNTLLAIAA